MKRSLLLASSFGGWIFSGRAIAAVSTSTASSAFSAFAAAVVAVLVLWAISGRSTLGIGVYALCGTLGDGALGR